VPVYKIRDDEFKDSMLKRIMLHKIKRIVVS
jgi:hypothetical protein